jgi:hypothetical protein
MYVHTEYYITRYVPTVFFGAKQHPQPSVRYSMVPTYIRTVLLTTKQYVLYVRVTCVVLTHYLRCITNGNEYSTYDVSTYIDTYINTYDT